MPEEVTFVADAGLIRVRSWGDTTIDQWQGSLQQVERLVAEHGVDRVLVDVREQESAPKTMEIFQFASLIPIHPRFAIVISEKTKEDALFLETVSRNRGRQVNTFESEEAALEWLTG